MTSAAFNSALASNGGIENLISIRLLGGEVFYIANSYNKKLASEEEKTTYIVKVDPNFIYIKRPINTPQGPQIEVSTMIDISNVYELNFFYDEKIHDTRYFADASAT